MRLFKFLRKFFFKPSPITVTENDTPFEDEHKSPPAKKVLVQTEQTQVLEYFKSELGDKIISFEETPSTTGTDAMNTVMENEGKDTMDWMQWFDAALRGVSQCAYVVNHTGNCGLWMNLYRGNVQNVFQFNELGNL